MKDSYHDFEVVAAVASASQSAASNGSAIDLQGHRSALVVVNTGAIAGDGDFSFKLQESDTTTSGDFADVDAGDVLGIAPATMAASTAYQVGYIGSKRYIRVSIVKTGGTSIHASAVAVLGHKAIAQAAA